MADLDFEMKLDRMFNEPPAFADNETFARLIEMRLDRGWGMRQIALGAAGLAAGTIGALQLVGSRVVLESGALATERRLDSLGETLGGLFRVGELTQGLPMGGQVIWMGAALAVMAVAFVVFRTVDDFK
ncbi:MAG: hypothetical protein KA105_09540 [Caulobacter sp.]|jgi:hypothetical protein|nr:hypothetical protein [Caulobacter sp.]